MGGLSRQSHATQDAFLACSFRLGRKNRRRIKRKRSSKGPLPYFLFPRKEGKKFAIYQIKCIVCIQVIYNELPFKHYFICLTLSCTIGLISFVRNCSKLANLLASLNPNSQINKGEKEKKECCSALLMVSFSPEVFVSSIRVPIRPRFHLNLKVSTAHSKLIYFSFN